MSIKIGVIQFPGSNCEYETVTALEAVGLDVTLIPWNQKSINLDQFMGFVLPGGFSYQDRVRAGAISAKLEITSQLVHQSSQKKPILGICNGCQILAEAGLVPDFGSDQNIQMTLTPNRDKERRVGFVCEWVYVTVKNQNQNVFTKYYEQGVVLPIQVNHGEGRFVFSETLEDTQINDLAQFVYVDETGNKAESFPTNPNGSHHNIAGISNKQGNVFAIMLSSRKRDI